MPEEKFPDSAVLESMWILFVEIGKFRKIHFKSRKMKSSFEAFITTRIRYYPFYLDEYKNAAEVMDKLINELGRAKGFKKLFTDLSANIPPPVTKLARARQWVVNEFNFLLLVLTGILFSKINSKKLRPLLS